MPSNNAFQKLRAQVGDGQKSIDWYMRNVRGLVGARVSGNTVMQSDIGSLTSKVEIGAMYMYFYDPKFKNELPFYDTFPLVLPFGPAKGGFYGINVHYLPYLLRAKVLGELMNFADSKTLTPTSKMRLSYNLLNSLQTAAEIKPCIKHYLTTHVRSQFMKINPVDWKAAIFLPVEAFVGATKESVFRDTRSKI
jgi:hypothetical protein